MRLLLAYTETEHEEKFYEMGPAPHFDKSEFHKVKDTIGLDFPNLPYYIDGEKHTFSKLRREVPRPVAPYRCNGLSGQDL